MTKLYGLSGSSGKQSATEFTDKNCMAKCFFFNYSILPNLSCFFFHVCYYCEGRHFCLKCEITSGQAKLPPGEREAVRVRSLASLQDDLARFTSAGAELESAKLYNNVIGPAFFDIPLDQVGIVILCFRNRKLPCTDNFFFFRSICCPNFVNFLIFFFVCVQVCEAGLHISLGIGLRLFKLLEHELQLVDIQLAVRADPESLSSQERDLVQRLNRAHELEKEAESMSEEAGLHQEVLDWFNSSAEPELEEDHAIPLDVQLAQLRSTIQGLYKSAKSKVNENCCLLLWMPVSGLIKSPPPPPHCFFFFLTQKAEARKLRDQVHKSIKTLGRCGKKLEEHLQELNIKRQAYHSGSFVGNHIHKMLEVSSRSRHFNIYSYYYKIITGLGLFFFLQG